MQHHVPAIEQTDPWVIASLDLIEKLFGAYEPRDFKVRFWDGTTWGPAPGQPERFTLVLRHPGSLRAMFWPPGSLALGEAYIYDDFDVEGDIEHAFSLADWLFERGFAVAHLLRSGAQLLRLPAPDRSRGERAARLSGIAHSKERDHQAVTYHYDVSNDFYALWLDRRMVYSCAYFSDAEEHLDVAQRRKLDYICRKLRLAPGERLLDLGCGWGGLVLHAAGRYGVDALGITLSQPQAEGARERIEASGLGDVCSVEVMDYRDVEDWGSFDKIVSVGMFEHVGRARLPEYFERAYRLLRPGGVFLNHGIATGVSGKRARPRRFSNGPGFVQKYVFPDGELVPIEVTLGAAASAGFEVRDVESLREHYALTLRAWVANLEKRAEEARQLTDEVTYRIWRLFMAGSAHGFATGELNVYQTLLVKPTPAGEARLPLTRQDWYE